MRLATGGVTVSRRDLATSGLLYVLCVSGMAWLRLYVFPDRIVSLSYALPLLLCLWHRDRRLLWGLCATFVGLSAWKSFGLLLPAADDPSELVVHWALHVANLGVVGVAVDRVIVATRRLRVQNERLARSNTDLREREAEIVVQAEELQQQNEEMQQQREEIDQQAEELQAQAEELRVVNAELSQRATMLQALLASLPAPGDDKRALEAVCEALLGLLGPDATGSAVLVRDGDVLRVGAAVGAPDLAGASFPVGGTFAAVVMEHDRTAYVDDLDARPDLAGKRARGVRSILAAPVHLRGKVAGAVEVYAPTARHWTTEEFRVVTWVAAQCSLLLEVRHLHDALTRTNGNLEELVEARTAELRQLVGELEHFSYTITHDMRAPLRAMHGFARMLETDDGELSATQRAEFLTRIVTAAARLDRLILDALDYSRTGLHEEMTLATVDPGPLLRGMLDSYPDLYSVRDRITVDGELPPVLANEAGLTQCFSNLLTNAVKFVRPGTEARVRVWGERRDGVVRIWVEDDGIGVPAEMRTRIFGLFQRANRHYEGTGLGLALVKKVAERMGGRVGVESEPGQGSRFWLELRGVQENP